MKFDVIIGNPPYQTNVVSNDNFSAVPIYHKFVDISLSLNPSCISMLIPSRWLNGVNKGIPRHWIETMIKRELIKELHDYEDSEDIFNGVRISGGVCYFLLVEGHKGYCNQNFYSKNNKYTRKGSLNSLNQDFILRDPNCISIINKVENIEGPSYFNSKKSFMHIVSSKGHFSFRGIFNSKWSGYSSEQTEESNIKYYTSKSQFGWIPESLIQKNKEHTFSHKVLIPFSYGDPKRKDTILGVPKYSEPGSISSESYLSIGHSGNLSEEECLNLISYVKTKFFRFLVKAKKFTQDAPKSVYQFVPLQDFSKPWTDKELYEKYKLTQEEVNYIEENVKDYSTEN